MRKHLLAAAGAALLSMGLAAGSALADTYTGGAGGTSGEAQAFNAVAAQIYGGTFSGNAVSLNNGTYFLTRVLDDGGTNPLALLGSATSGAEDTKWQDGIVNVNIEMKLAGDTHKFGFQKDGADSPTYVIDPAVTGATQNNVKIGPGEFNWVLYDSWLNGPWYSDPLKQTGTENLQDHMVTFEVTGPQITTKTWLLWWEDRPTEEGTVGYNKDYVDFQDSVVQISVVPLPGAAWGGIGLLGMMGSARLYKSRRQRD